jgi:hypothetical protein
MNNKIHDEYATKPRTIKSIFSRAIEYLGQLQINVRRIETTPYYLRTPWRKNRCEQIGQSLCAIIPKGSSSIRFRAETAKILEEKYNEHIKIYTDSSKKDDNIRPKVWKKTKTSKYGEQEAIIKAIFVTKRTGERLAHPCQSKATLTTKKKSKNTVTQKATGRRKRESHPSLGARP